MLKIELIMICVALVRVYGTEGKRIYIKLSNVLKGKNIKAGSYVSKPI